GSETARGKVGVAARLPSAAIVRHGLSVMSGSKAREAEGRVPLPGRGAAEPALPDRYRIKRDDTGAVLTCVEAPTVSVRVQHGFTVTAAAARSAAPGSVFLDGAAQGEPFLDPKREVYNLDHHEACVRSFLLATCEQAMVLVRKGLDLRKREWTVYANDADLDTVLAIWVILAHLRLTDRSAEPRARIMPLVRLQGVIDAQGLDMQDLSALPPELLAEIQACIDELREPELALKQRGRWGESDLLGYTADRLRAIDRLVYSPTHFDDVTDIDQLARVEIANGSVAVVCRSKAGIYEVERQLRRLHGKRLGVIVLRTGAATYTLRQVNPYLPTSLDRFYAHLNLVDPGAGGHRSANRWGGSTEIGGSPRTGAVRVASPRRAGLVRPSALRHLRRAGGRRVDSRPCNDPRARVARGPGRSHASSRGRGALPGSRPWWPRVELRHAGVRWSLAPLLSGHPLGRILCALERHPAAPRDLAHAGDPRRPRFRASAPRRPALRRSSGHGPRALREHRRLDPAPLDRRRRGPAGAVSGKCRLKPGGG